MNYEEYEPVIMLGGGLAPSGSGTFAVARACDILMHDETRLDKYLEKMSGSSSGSFIGKMTLIESNLTADSTLQELHDFLRSKGFTVNDEAYISYKATTTINNVTVVTGTTNVYCRISDLTMLGRYQVHWHEWGLFQTVGGISAATGYTPDTTIRAFREDAYSLLKTDSISVSGAINELHDDIEALDPNPDVISTGMPTIRFVGLIGDRALYPASEYGDGTIKFTIEVLDGKVNYYDRIQVCGMRTFGISPKNPKKKRKLRRFAEFLVANEDEAGKRFYTIEVFPTRNALAHLGHNNRQSGGPTTIYFRVRRSKGAYQSNDSGMTVDAYFSNVVAVPIMYTVLTLNTEDGEEVPYIEVKPI